MSYTNSKTYELYYEAFNLEDRSNPLAKTIFRVAYGTKIEESFYIADQAFRHFYENFQGYDKEWPLGIAIFNLEGDEIVEAKAEIEYEPVFRICGLDETYDPSLYVIPKSED